MDGFNRTIAVFREMAIIQERMDAILKARLPADLPPTQFKLLNHLIFTTNANETASEIARNFHVSLSAMSQVISQLTKKGFVELQIRRQDARKKTIVITEQGRSAHQQASALIDIGIKRFSKKFKLNDMQQLYELSHQFRLCFEEHT
ncbi:MAG: DNA-binding MarR family transcriptional regulator [Candidatus Azotimanducaceae bacterium]|jgi:DNA-binding MarR family transcriptional regulator